MTKLFITPSEAGSEQALPLHAVLQRELDTLLERLAPVQSAWLKSIAFGAKDGELALLPGPDGALAGAVLGLGKGLDVHALALFSERLPKGSYQLESVPPEFGGARAAY